MRPPALLGRVMYFCGYPVFRLLIRGTVRAYVIVQVRGEVLVTQNWLGYQKKWRLPGGGVQAGETPLSAAQRELIEEIGLDIEESQFKRLGKGAFKASFNYDYHLFLVKLPKKPHISIDEREILHAEFVPIAKLKGRLVSEEVATFLKLAK